MRFGFAWVDAADATWSDAYAREDERVYAFSLRQAEGDLATLDLDVSNPRKGLLAPSRKQWMWFSAIEGEGTDAVATPLLFGRVVGVAQDMGGDLIRMQIVARPSDFDTRKLAAAAALKVSPWYDPIWLTEEARADPDSVLEGRAAHWHVDPMTHAITAVAIDDGPAGTVDIGGGFFADTLSTAITQQPLLSVQVQGDVSWDQAADGDFDITPHLIAAFIGAGQPAKYDGYITSYTGGGLMADWPAEGKRIGGVWTYGRCDVTRYDGWRLPADYKQVVMSTASVAQFPLWYLAPLLHVRYSIKRRREEGVSFTLTADAQALVSDPDDAPDQLTLASSDIALPIDPGDTLPIGDVRRRSYFKTARGRQSVENLIAMARARLISRARCVTVTASLPLADGLTLTLRHNARLADPRLPGGEAAGKVSALSFSLDGDTGEATAQVVISCMIGKGATVSAVEGIGDYVSDGYVTAGYQSTTGTVVMPASGDVTYEDYMSTPIVDDGLDLIGLNAGQAVQSLYVINGPAIQKKVLSGFAPDWGGWNGTDQQAIYDNLKAAVEAVESVYTQVDLTLLPVEGGPFRTDYALAVSDLMLARTIDLEAS